MSLLLFMAVEPTRLTAHSSQNARSPTLPAPSGIFVHFFNYYKFSGNSMKILVKVLFDKISMA